MKTSLFADTAFGPVPSETEELGFSDHDRDPHDSHERFRRHHQVDEAAGDEGIDDAVAEERWWRGVGTEG
jgi:hypothetical protein